MTEWIDDKTKDFVSLSFENISFDSIINRVRDTR